MGAAQRWEAALASWAWPPAIREAAPADPWRLDPDQLASRDDDGADGDTPADVAAREGLPRRGSVLDVGCGTGAASAPLRSRAGTVTGVDPRSDMLEQFTAAATAELGLLGRLAGGAPAVTTVQGRWPDVADEVPPADVVVAHNVLYDVTEGVAAFVAALHEHARQRVVVALTARHPLHWVNPYAEAVHGIRRPAEPTAEVAADVVREVTGTVPSYRTWTHHVRRPDDDDAVLRLVARRACVRPDQLDDLRDVLARVPVPTTREMVALVWDRTA
jgi:SAM-dependent methyltransferase